MSYKSELQANNIDLQSILNTVNGLPDAGGGTADEPVIVPLSITENGTYTTPNGVDGYSPVVVKVPSSGGGDDHLVERLNGTLTEYASTDVTQVASYGLYGLTTLVSVSLPNATVVRGNGLMSCTNLQNVNLPKVTQLQNYAMQGCTSLTRLDLPALTSIQGAVFSNVPLTALILRGSKMCSLGNKNALTGTAIASGTGYIYVPASLLDSYVANSAWSSFAAQFRALEDYTVDGTVTGALDESKI